MDFLGESSQDIWDKYKGGIETQPFVEGIIPRIITDQFRPIKTIVFGKEEFLSEQINKNATSRVRIVGAIKRQYCPQIPCNIGSKWSSEIIIVAIDPGDIRYKAIFEIEELKKKLNTKP